MDNIYIITIDVVVIAPFSCSITKLKHRIYIYYMGSPKPIGMTISHGLGKSIPLLYPTKINKNHIFIPPIYPIKMSG